MQVGRQVLSYDDERIIGPNDWAMAGVSHDVLKMGYEGHGHKLHAIFAYNQNANNADKGTSIYENGSMPYKSMITAWYHYDVPNFPLGASLLLMNIGMQGGFIDQNPHTEWQQVWGGYLKFSPKKWSLEGSYYRQTGREEHGGKLRAWMASVKGTFDPSPVIGFDAGYDYMSGEQFPIAINGGLGLIFHDKARGFSTLFGSHHEFYGAMDFFYLDSYVHNFSPGLQNLYVGGNVSPVTGLKINAAYHFYAIAADLQIHTEKLNKALGHEMELNVGYTFEKFATVSAGYTFMRGTETMQTLQNLTDNRRLHWGWVMLTVNPTLFNTVWQDKKR